LKVLPGVNDVGVEAHEPVHGGRLEHNRQVVSHDRGVASSGLHGGGVFGEPLLWISMDIVGWTPEILKLAGH
jgi:hypothetical protein